MVEGGKCCGESARVGVGRTVVNRVVRDVFTEVVTLECRPERGEGASHLYLGEGWGRWWEESQQGTARVKILCWACLVGKK